MYYLQANGLAKAFNKTLINILKKVVQIPSLRVVLNEGITNEEVVHLRLQALDSLDKQRLNAQQRLECYDPIMYLQVLQQEGLSALLSSRGMVLTVRRPIMTIKKEKKFVPKWDSPSIIVEAYASGSYMVVDQDGLKVGPINDRYLKSYLP
ncbi:hypothetical protein LIER_05228 [Lithospermum erythrorhizon]|uniref:Uncharacterized protein n=1 Tax=Lithospermum erythrorhizon TaxID=34254 RepID=A0AAV3NZR4_LITER